MATFISSELPRGFKISILLPFFRVIFTPSKVFTCYPMANETNADLSQAADTARNAGIILHLFSLGGWARN
jgi:hypothetical protein